MKKTIEAIKNGQELEAREYLELVNSSVVAIVHLERDGHQLISMRVNGFSEYEGECTLSQGFVGDAITFGMEEIVDVEADVVKTNEDELDDINLNVTLENGSKVHIYMAGITAEE